MKTNEEFFDSISSFYDKMINFDSAIERRKAALSNFVDADMRTAADFGCGTGLDSIGLSLLGLEVTGFDISANMIEQAEINSKIYNTKIKFVQAELDQITSGYRDEFDLIVSLGNTLANLSADKLDAALANAFRLLRPGGKMLLQILHFERIKSTNERIINITGKDNFFYIRFYDFLEKEINFNIIKFDSTNPSKREMVTTKLFIYNPPELQEMLQRAGFRNTILYSDLSGKEFSSETSKDLIMTALK
jgi:ubiquinone/menaquinone biosynthesis C-methylase UbiE